MDSQRKMRRDFRIEGLIPAITMLAIFGLAIALSGITTGIMVLSLGFIAYSLFSIFQYYRTRNISYIAAFIFQACFGIYLSISRLGFLTPPAKEIPALFQFGYIASGVWLFYLLFTRRAKWKGREVFELAARSIAPDKDVFTARPHPAGKMDYSRDDLKGLADFLSRNLVAMPYREQNRIVFVPVKSEDEFRFMLAPAKFLENRTWISFDFQGNVTVSISRRDYREYTDELSFEKLCDNLGKLFIEFMENYQKGDADRILIKLNEIKPGLTS